MLATSLTRTRGSGRSARVRRIGVVDVGSNSVRLVVHDVRGRAMNQRFNEKFLAGLGRDLQETGKLHPEGVEQAIVALKRFAAITRAQKVDTVIPFATAAVRDAADGPDFCRRVRAETGFELKVLSGPEEALIAAQGVVAGAPGVSGVVGDLGGSSLELAHLRDASFLEGATFPLGPLALNAANGKTDKRKMAKVKKALAKASFFNHEEKTFIAVGGAWRAIANVYMEITNAPLRILQNYEVPVADLRPLLAELANANKHTDIVQKVAKRRVATIPYAAMVLDVILEMGKFETLMVSSYGVREGIVFGEMSVEERASDPLDAGLEAMVASDSHAAEFGRALSSWVAAAAAYTLSPRLTNAACRLVDIGAMLHPDHRADLAFELVARAPLPGLTHRDRASLALAIATRYTRQVNHPVSDRLIDSETATRARALGALMRLGANLSGRSASLLKKAELKCDGEKLELYVPRSQAALLSDTVRRRLQQAGSELRMEAIVHSDFKAR